MLSVVDSHIFVESSSSLLHSPRFENAISCNGQNFPSMKDFKDSLYLLSIGGLFLYKFKRNSPKHTNVVCSVDGCPWKVKTNAIGAT